MRFERIAWTVSSALVALSGSSCVTLDSFVFNPIHCSNVSSSTCEEEEERSRACTPCDEPYDFGKEYGFFEDVFEEPSQPRPIADELIEQQTFSTSDGIAELDLYFIRSHGDDPALANTTILYNHGNYASIETYLARVRILHEMGFNVLVWDYRGYGKSMPTTTPSPTELISDALEIRALANTLAPDPDKIIIYGFSLGVIPSTEMALDDVPCSMLFEAPFTSLGRIAQRNAGTSLGEGFLSEGRYNNLEKIKEYPNSLFVMIGDEDELFTLDDAQDFVDNAPGASELWVIEGARHGVGHGVPEAATYATYDARIRAFLSANASNCID